MVATYADFKVLVVMDKIVDIAKGLDVEFKLDYDTPNNIYICKVKNSKNASNFSKIVEDIVVREEVESIRFEFPKSL